MTPESIAALIIAVTTACATLGRGIVWLVQRQSNNTVSALKTENALLRSAYRRRVRRQQRRVHRPRSHR